MFCHRVLSHFGEIELAFNYFFDFTCSILIFDFYKMDRLFWGKPINRPVWNHSRQGICGNIGLCIYFNCRGAFRVSL